MKTLSIRSKVLILTFIILVPLTILQLINIRADFNRSLEQKFQANEELAKAVSKTFINYVNELWVQELIISNELAEDENKADAIQVYLDHLLSSGETSMERLSFVNTNGKIVASTDKSTIGKSIIGQDHFTRITKGEEKVLSNLIKGEDGEIEGFPVSRAVKRDGKLVGIIVATVDVNKLVSKIPNLVLHEGDVLAITDNYGYRVYHSGNPNMSFEERLLPKDAPTWKSLNGEVLRTYKRKSQFDGAIRMGIDYPIKEFGWVVTINSKRNVVLKNAYDQAINSIISLFVVSLVSILISFILGRRIVEPLLILKEKANEFKSGDYSVRTNITGSDEIACTAEAFDHMANSIQEYDEMKSQFFSNISHELKTPINVIYSTLQLIESIKNTTNPDEFVIKTSKYLSGVKQNLFRLIKLVDNMIDVDRLETGYLEMTPRNIDIISVIENICLSVVKYTEQKGITMVFDTEIEEKETYCDPNFIERIILNLISNALKFTDEGGYIYINIYDLEDSIKISVRDTGIGIPEDKLDFIFDRFKQVDSSLNRNHEGSGLGLSVVKNLVEAHSGSIQVSSEIGKGTEFLIDLPIIMPLNIKDHEKLVHEDSNTIEKIQVEFSDIYSIDLES